VKALAKKKDSEEYKKEQLLKHEAEEKRNSIEQDLMKIRSQIDFKALEKIYHSNEKKMSILKIYQKNFTQVIKEPEHNETYVAFLNIIAEQDNNKKQVIETKIEDLKKEFENINAFLSKQDSLEFFHDKINRVANELRQISSEKDKNLKRIETIKKAIDSVNEDISSNLEKLGLRVES